MKISLTYLLTELAKFNPDHRINSDAYFDQIRLLDLGSLDLKPNTLYVTNVRDFGIVNNRIKNCTLIVCDHLGLMEKVDVSQDMNLIVVKDRISTERLMNHLIGVFDAFQTTANDLLAMTLEHKEYFVLYDRLTKLMDIPLIVLNDDFGILGTTNGAPREVGENLKHLLRLESEDLHNEKWSRWMPRRVYMQKSIASIWRLSMNSSVSRPVLREKKNIFLFFVSYLPRFPNCFLREKIEMNWYGIL